MKKFGIAILILLLVIGGVVYYIYANLNGIVKAAIEHYGSEATKASVSVGSVDLKIADGQGTLTNLRIGNPSGFQTKEAFTLQTIHVKLDTASIQGKGPIVVNEIAIDSPSVTYENGAKGSNLDVLQQNAQAYGGGNGKKSGGGGQAAPSKSSERKFIIDNLYIRNGKVDIRDNRLAGQNLQSDIPTIHLTNIGRAKGGATPAEVTSAVVSALSNAASQIAVRELENRLGNMARDKAGKALKGGLGGLFGR